jgi:hypothetical protein
VTTLIIIGSVLVASVGVCGAYMLRDVSRFWSIGLVLGAIAALAYAGANNGNEQNFKIYYALGAAMFPGWIGAGSLNIVFKRKLVLPFEILVVLLSVVQLVLTEMAAIELGTLFGLSGTNGEGIITPGPWVIPTVLFNTLGLGMAAVAALWAWWLAFRRPSSTHAAWAIGLSVVVVGVLARSAGAYRILTVLTGGRDFILLDLLAFALIWAGGALCKGLPGPLQLLLKPPDLTPGSAAGAEATAGIPASRAGSGAARRRRRR